MTEVQGRTAFITGGGNGIGLAIARAFAGAGAKLALADLDIEALARAKSELQAMTEVETFKLDVRDREAYAAVADAAESALGPVSLLFNNAGVAGGAPAEKITPALWNWSVGINLGGVINGVQTFLPRIAERGQGGHIVNTASGAGLAATTSGLLYQTAKYAVVGMTESMNPELAPMGIGVTVLCPGPVATDIVTRSDQALPRDGLALSDEQAQRASDRKELMTGVLKQGVSPDEVGQMVLKAVRENALYIHTDRVMEEAIKSRTQAILAALPA